MLARAFAWLGKAAPPRPTMPAARMRPRMASKSRPAFRPLLGERMEVIVPPTHYDKVDF